MSKPTSDCRATERNHPWPMVRLGDVCEVQRGGSPRPIKDYLTDSPEGLNWIKIGDVEPAGKYITQTTEKIKTSGLNKTRKVSTGDFLLSNSMSFGRPYILKIDGCIHDGWLVLKGFSKTFTEDFFYYLLRSPIVQEQFDKLAHGSTVRNLNTDVVSRVSLPLPPLPVQREIVARLERELAAVEKMKKGFEALDETAKAEFKAELKEVFEGLKRDGAGMRKIGDVCTEISTGPFGSSLHKNDYIVGGTPIINPMHIVGQRLIPTDNMAVDEKTIARLSAYCLRENDVIIGRRGEMGRAALVTSREKGWLCGTGCFFLRLRANVSPRYFVELLCSDYCKSQMEYQAIGTTIPNLNHTILREIEMPMPELAEQEWVVGSVTALRAKMEKLEAKAQEGVAVCETMRKAILKEAFE